MPLPIILGGVVSGIGSAVGGFLGYKGQKDTNKANIAMSDKQMDFQAEQADLARDYMRDMSGTAYERAMADMKESGLNPILAYSQGGASTPSSPAMSGSMPVMQNPMAAGANVGTQIGNSASNIATAKTERDKMNEQIKVIGEQEGLTNQQIHLVQENMDKVRKEVKNIQAQTEGRELENQQTKILTDFYDSANFARIAKDIGISPQVLKSIAVAIFGGRKKK